MKVLIHRLSASVKKIRMLAFSAFALFLAWMSTAMALAVSPSGRFEILHSALEGGGGSSSAGLVTLESSITGFNGSSLTADGKISLAVGEVEMLNESPIPGKDFIELPLSGVFSFPVTDLLVNDFDREGNTLFFSIDQTNTTRGGTVRLSNGIILYTPPSEPSGSDSFTYTLMDSFGGKTIGAAVLTSAALAPQLVSFQTDGRNLTLHFLGLTNRFYLLQFRGDFEGNSFWRDFPNENKPIIVQTDGTGMFQFTVPIDSRQGYFRAADAESLDGGRVVNQIGSQISMSFRGVPHANYKLQFRASLGSDDSWRDYPSTAQPFTIQTANDGTCSLVAPIGAGNGFFQLVLRGN